MEKTVLDWLLKNYPIIFLCIVVAVVVWIIARFYFRRFKKMEDTVKELPCSRLEEDIHRLEKAEEMVANLPCSRHEDNFRTIDEKLTKIITILTMKYPSSASAFSIKRSPRQLNEKGKELFNACGGRDLLENNSEMLLEMILRSNPKTALDVESQAYEVLAVNQDKDMFNGVKQWIYNSPNWEIDTPQGKEQYSITLADVCFVVSIPLRDMYLSKHPEILPE